MLHRAAPVLVALGLFLSATRTWAQDEIAPEAQAQARAHFQQGKAAFELGNFQDALDQYKTAYRIAPLPGFLFNIAQCHRNLGDPEKAIFAFRLFLRKRPDASNREAVLALIDDLQSKIEERARLKAIPVNPPESRPIIVNPPPSPTPIYKRWWFWTLVGLAASGAAVGTYLGVRTQDAKIPDSPLGVWNVRPAR